MKIRELTSHDALALRGSKYKNSKETNDWKT